MAIEAVLASVNPLTAGLLSVVVLGSMYFLRSNKPRPPGPFAYPLVGNLPQVAKTVASVSGTGRKPFLATRKLAEEYGGVATLWMGAVPMVVVTGYENCREGLLDKGSIFINRPTNMFFFKEIFKNKGVLTANGAEWRDTRKFTLAGMREFGVGKMSQEERFHEEIAIVSKEMAKHEGKPFDPKDLLSNAISNTICCMVFGHRFDYDDKDFSYLNGLLDYMFNSGGVNMPENYFPWMNYLPMSREQPKKLAENANYINSYVQKRIVEHETSYDPDNPRDFIDVYIKMKREGNQTKMVALKEEDAYRTIVDLFLGGSETTATSLHWLLYYVIAYPEVQAKCHEEIEKVVGGGRNIALSDRSQFPYIVATIQESQRLANSTPSTPPHVTTEDTTIGGVPIPAQTPVLFHIQSVHTDPKYWGPDHDAFRPQRWISDTGELLKKPAFMPFSVGPRTCIGDTLAKNQLFLFFANLLQNFTFKPATGDRQPHDDGHQPGITFQPHKFDLIALSR